MHQRDLLVNLCLPIHVAHLVVPSQQSRDQEYKVDEARAAALLAKMLETVNNPTQNDAGDDVPGARGGEVQGYDITLLKSKDATITTLRAQLASEIEERAADAKKLAAHEERIAVLEIKLRASEERARASEERANKMKDVAMFLMGNM